MTEGFVGCDWGTSNLRLFYVDAREERVVGGVSSEEGVKHAYAHWQAGGGDRTGPYYDILARNLARLQERLGRALDGAAVIVSGMASSSIGIQELPYATLPFSLRGDTLGHRLLPEPLPGGQRVVLLSGLRSADDVMRGEETQLIGLRHRLGEQRFPVVYVLPGTHSKHVLVDGALVREFRTFMTGELFETLSAHTILRESVRRTELTPERVPTLVAGVRVGIEAPLLHALFGARTRTLFARVDPGENFWYLSGVLVGSEVAALRSYPGHPVTLCAPESLRAIYEAALGELGLDEPVTSVPPRVVEESAAWGQLAIFRRLVARRELA